jgi:hypothetical protein
MASTKKVTPAPAAVEAPAIVTKVGVGSFCKDMILNSNWNNKEILEKVLETYPTAKTSYACIAWYRSDLRSKGLIGPRVHAKKEVEVPAVTA